MPTLYKFRPTFRHLWRHPERMFGPNFSLVTDKQTRLVPTDVLKTVELLEVELSTKF